jgi:hypothetical protein
MVEDVAWVYQRPGGGRGFGFTGGHSHFNWANNNFRKVVLNGIVWTAGLEVPADGVNSVAPTFQQLDSNLDKPKPANFDSKRYQTHVEKWQKEAGE